MIRNAVEFDIEAICAIDSVAGMVSSRRDYIRGSVREGNCHVLTIENDVRIAAYGILVYSFYDCGMIEMLMVASEQRRQGLGTELMRHMETVCRTEKLFTSTNESNTQMRALLAKLGYSPSGIIYNLDPGDPELVYFKQLR